jgi:hypothetical protein
MDHPVAYMAAKSDAERIRMSAGSNARLYVVDHMEMVGALLREFPVLRAFHGNNSWLCK